MLSRPIVLTIAGFDPSGCAGILADIKTFEANGIYGMAVCTANTEQSVTKFNKPNWISETEIFAQLNLLLEENQFDFVKIGLVKNFELLNQLVDVLKKHNPNVKIVWDPVCKASASYEFHKNAGSNLLQEIFRKIYLITPNLDEIAVLVPGTESKDAAKALSQYCNALLKGGHGEGDFSTDILYTDNIETKFIATRLKSLDKRGTGCVLSAAIAANLAKGMELEEACRVAKDYVTAYLSSSNTLIGFHDYENKQAAIHYN